MNTISELKTEHERLKAKEAQLVKETTPPVPKYLKKRLPVRLAILAQTRGEIKVIEAKIKAKQDEPVKRGVIDENPLISVPQPPPRAVEKIKGLR